MSTQRKTLRELSEDFKGMVESYSGNLDPSNLSTKVLERLIHELRQDAIIMLYGGNSESPFAKRNTLNQFWTQPVILNYEVSIQDDYQNVPFCYNRFRTWPAISIDKMRDGRISVSGVNQTKQVYRVNGFEGFRTQLNKGAASMQNRVFYWYDNNYLNISDENIRSVRERCVYFDPTEVQTYDYVTKTWGNAYDPDNDPYPVTGEVIGLMRDIFMQRIGKLVLSTIADGTGDNIPDRQKGGQKNV